MKTKKRVLKTKSKTIWRDFKKELPLSCSDIYSTPEYYKIYEHLGAGRATVFYYEENGRKAFYPFLINSVNQLGYNLDQNYYDIQGAYGYNGVISNSYEPSFIDAFYKKFDEYCKKNSIIAEFTRFHPLIENSRFSQNHMDVIYDRETVVVDLTKSHEEIWNSEYSRKNRNIIRKAEKIGYKIEILDNPDNNFITTFKNLYENTMHKVNADPFYFFKSNYYSNIFKFLAGNIYLINVIDPIKEVMCSCIFLHYGDYFHYHLLGRAATADCCANNYLLDQAIIIAQKLGVKYLHLGGGRTSADNDSLLRFKKNFSRKGLSFYIGKKIINQDVYNKVVRQWSEKYPEKNEKLRNLLLKYRY